MKLRRIYTNIHVGCLLEIMEYNSVKSRHCKNMEGTDAKMEISLYELSS